MTKRTDLSLFWLIVAFAFALRVVSLEERSYWVDEILTLTNSVKPWPQMLEAIQNTDNDKPPLYFVFMHQWLRLGDSEFWTRLPSAIFGALTCGFVFLTGLRITDRIIGWWAGIFLALSPFHLGYSQEARMYALLAFLASAALWKLVLFLQEKKTSDLVGFGILSVLVSYTFSYGFFLLGLAALLLVVERKNLGFRCAWALLVTLLVSFSLFAPWLLSMVHSADLPGAGLHDKGPPWSAIVYTFFSLGYGFDLGPSTGDLQSMGGGFFPHHPLQTSLTLAGLIVLTLITLRGFISLRHDRLFVALTLGGVGVFLLGPAVISLLKPAITYNPRYAILTLLPFAWIFAAGVAALWKDVSFPRLVVLLYAAFLALSLGNFYFNPYYWREDMRKASQIVAALHPQPTTVVVSADYLTAVVARYYTGTAALVGFSNANPVAFEADAQALQIALSSRQTTRFALIYARPDHGDPGRQLIPWLERHYRLLEQHAVPGAQVYLFEALPPAS